MFREPHYSGEECKNYPSKQDKDEILMSDDKYGDEKKKYD
jgi:hypothetical protein